MARWLSLAVLTILVLGCGEEGMERSETRIVQTNQNARIFRDDPTQWQPRLTSKTDSVGVVPAYPNPARLHTDVVYKISVSGEHVGIAIYGPDDTLIRTLVGEYQEAGIHKVRWFLKDDQGRPVPAGVYRVEIEAQGLSSSGLIRVLGVGGLE